MRTSARPPSSSRVISESSPTTSDADLRWIGRRRCRAVAARPGSREKAARTGRRQGANASLARTRTVARCALGTAASSARHAGTAARSHALIARAARRRGSVAEQVPRSPSSPPAPAKATEPHHRAAADLAAAVGRAGDRPGTDHAHPEPQRLARERAVRRACRRRRASVWFSLRNSASSARGSPVSTTCAPALGGVPLAAASIGNENVAMRRVAQPRQGVICEQVAARDRPGRGGVGVGVGVLGPDGTIRTREQEAAARRPASRKPAPERPTRGSTMESAMPRKPACYSTAAERVNDSLERGRIAIQNGAPRPQRAPRCQKYQDLVVGSRSLGRLLALRAGGHASRPWVPGALGLVAAQARLSLAAGIRAGAT